MPLNFSEFPKYVNKGTLEAEKDASRVEKQVKLIESNKQKIKEDDLQSFKDDLIKIEPKDQELILTINYIYSNISRNLIVDSILFVKGRDLIIKTKNKNITLYSHSFKDLNKLKRVLNELEYESSKRNYMFLDRLTEPYLNQMIEFIEFIHEKTNLFFSETEEASNPLSKMKEIRMKIAKIEGKAIK